MEPFNSHKIIPLLFSLFFHFSSLFLPSSSSYYTPLVSYSINCGSSSSLSIDGRDFVGDAKPAGKFSLSGRGSKTVENSNALDLELYQTARIFRKPAYYEFDIVDGKTGLYVVRFHFYSFPSMGNLSNARFNVSAFGFWLLSNFSPDDNNYPPIQEFLVSVNKVGKMRVGFVPYKDDYFSFVNAIELFTASPKLIPDVTGNQLQGISEENDYDGVLNGSLHVIHRINVGGQNLMPSNDSLVSYWIPDDDYLLTKNAARTSSPLSVNPQYQTDQHVCPDNSFCYATPLIAPDNVYQTAKQLNTDDTNTSRISNFNITWRFDVRKTAEHLVRLHFCDIVSLTSNEFLNFYLYINSNFSRVIKPYDVFPQTGAPFYTDYVVHSDDSGFLNISVGPNINSPYRTAFLNGVEIMELANEPAPLSSAFKGKHLLIIICSVVGGIVILALVIIIVFIFCLKRTKWTPVDDFNWPMTAFQGGSSYSRTTIRTVSDLSFADLNLGLKLPLPEILYATKRFDPKLMIGEGGFGKVYKGILRNGTKVAVKRSEPGHGQGLSEFKTEIMVLSKIRHQHLVSLIGYCDERDEMILVYKFMENGTLQDHLYVLQGEEARQSISRAELSWPERLQICIGVAKGLNYLHTGSSGSNIIHRDIKSTNILLDEHFVAKVADFGISRFVPLNQTHVSTDVKGSFGYLDPEYFKCLQLTQKSDVYSFGVVLLEVLCARPAIGHRLPREQVNLANWAMAWQKKDELEKIVDHFLVDRINPNSLRKFGDTVEKCLQEKGVDRPNMVDVLWDLEYCLQLQNSVMPNEDSVTDASWSLPAPVMQRLPSEIVNDVINEDGMLPADDFGSFPGAGRMEADEVFLQLKIDEAR